MSEGFTSARGPGWATIVIPLRTISASNERPAHWSDRSRRVKRERVPVGLLLRSEKIGLVGFPMVVTLTRVAPRLLDDDNARGAMKASRDGVADALGIDDRDPRVEWRYEQRKGAYAVVVDARRV